VTPSTLALVAALAMAGPAVAATRLRLLSTPPNVDVSQRAGNESETAVAVNPTNPQNVVIFSNVDHPKFGMLEAVSFDGGSTWAASIVGDGDSLGLACCDPSISFDQDGNLFLTYLLLDQNGNVPPEVPVALSSDGGITFSVIATLKKPASLGTSAAIGKEPAAGKGLPRGLFHFVDQPTITTGAGSAWVVFNAGGPMVASGAAVTGPGQVGPFIPPELVPGTHNCSFGDVAIGPGGQVAQVCQKSTSGEGDGKLWVSVDPDGLGPAGFGKATFVTQTHVGGFDFIPAQSDRSVDAESGLAWDRSGGPHSGRLYLLYANEHPNESDNLDVEVRSSDDQGTTWSAPVRVNDDATKNSQFNPKLSLDPATGNLAVSWYDCRQDQGDFGPGDTNGVPNDDAEFWGAFSTDGGKTFTANVQISAGVSNSHDSGNSIDFGDYSGLSFFGGVAHPAWADNSNSTGNNPDGQLAGLDIMTAAVSLTP